jgi:hypothetical protein
MRCIRVVLAAVSLAGLCLSPLSSAQGTPLAQARALIDRGQPQAALTILAPLEATRAGDVPFDYVLALATLDAGDSTTATLIFDRILLQAPDFHGARIDLGRAYLAQGRLADAQRELERARAAGPPEQAAAAIDAYLARIERQRRRSRFSRYLSATTRAGYDSNVNSATDVNEFLGFNLNPRSREQDSDFFEVAFAAGGAYAVRPQLTMSGRLNARMRRNARASFADSDVIAGSVRLDHRIEGQRRTLELQGLSQFVDGDHNLAGLAFSGDWRFEVRDGLWLGPLLRLRAVRYQDELDVKDINQWTLGAIGSWSFGPDGQGNLESSMSLGRDRPQKDGSRYDREFTLFSIGLNWRFNDTLHGALSGAIEDSEYRAIFFEQAFSSPREDTSWQARGVLDWRFARRWRLNHSLTYRKNDTDIDVFAFDRFEATLGVRYVWY